MVEVFAVITVGKLQQGPGKGMHLRIFPSPALAELSREADQRGAQRRVRVVPQCHTWNLRHTLRTPLHL